MWGLKTKELHKYGTDLTMMAQLGKLDPVVGREKEMELLIQSLLKRRNSSVCLVGDAGVGKTAIVQAFALKISESSVPMKLRGKKIFSIDIGKIVDGGKNSEEIERRVKGVFEEVRESEGEVILFIDDVHNFIREDGVAAILKFALARDDFKCIGVTTEEEFTLKHMFESIMQVREPSKEECTKMVEGIIVKYQNHHGLKYEEKAYVLAVNLSKQYMREIRLPKSAVDLIDKAGAFAHMLGKACVTEKEIEHVVSTCTGVRVEASHMLDLEYILYRRIIGQTVAVGAVCRAIRRARIGVRDAETKPIGCFLFSGPTAVGKTELARVLAEEYFGSDGAIVRLDTHELTEHHALSRLMGKLAEEVRRRPHSLVLFDGIEKAHEKVLNILLRVSKTGRLSDGEGKTVDFSNTIIIVTSNSVDALEAETVNVFEEVVAFNPLEKVHMKKILEIMIRQYGKKEKIQVIIGEKLKESLLSVGYDAWALKRAFSNTVETKLSEEFLRGRVIQRLQILPRFHTHRGC